MPHSSDNDDRPTVRPHHRRLVLVATALVVAVVVAACGGSDAASSDDSESGEFLSGYTREPVPSVAGISLPDATDGTAQPMTAEPGGLRLVYFGYTNCPDVCPTTMVDIKSALAELPADERDRIDVDMATVVPARDVPEKITAYVTTFVPDGRALRTEDSTQLRDAADAFGASYSVEIDADGNVEVGHSGDIYGVDDNGDVVMQWPFGTEYPTLAKDFSQLLARQS